MVQLLFCLKEFQKWAKRWVRRDLLPGKEVTAPAERSDPHQQRNTVWQSRTFTPRSVPGAKNPPLLNKKCYGVDLTRLSNEEIWEKGINFDYVIDAYRNLNLGDHFFRPFFEKLIGVDYVREMIKAGKSSEEIKAMWHDDVEKFREQRRPYLLYEE